MPPNSVASVWPSPGGSCVLVVARSCHLSRSRVAPQLSIATAMQHRWPVGGEVASGVCPPIEPLAPLLLSKPASSLRFLPCESTSEGAPSCEGRDYSGSSLIHCHNFQSSGQARALHRLVSMFEQSSLLMAAACSSAMRAPRPNLPGPSLPPLRQRRAFCVAATAGTEWVGSSARSTGSASRPAAQGQLLLPRRAGSRLVPVGDCDFGSVHGQAAASTSSPA